PVARVPAARPFELQVLPHDGLKHALAIPALEPGEVDLSVALTAVRVSRPDQPALEENWNVQRAAGLQLVDVHVRAVLPGPQRRHRRHRIVLDAAPAGRRSAGVDADREWGRERGDGELHAGLELDVAH